MHTLIPIETERLAPATRYADQPLTLRTRFIGMATTLTACVTMAVIGLWQASAPTPIVDNAPALSVMNVAPLAAPPAAPTDKPSGEPQEKQESASEPDQQQQLENKAASPPKPATPPIQRVAAVGAVGPTPPTTAPADSSSTAASDQPAEQQAPASQRQQASAPPASNAPSARVASAERDRWESQVLAALNRVKHYPREAARLRQEGISWICITMDQRGKVRSVRLHKQSGHRVLDQEALAMASRASPLPRPPASLKMLRIEVTVPIAFSMDHA